MWDRPQRERERESSAEDGAFHEIEQHSVIHIMVFYNERRSSTKESKGHDVISAVYI